MKIEKKVEVLEKEADSLSLEAEKKENFRLCQRLMLWELKQNLLDPMNLQLSASHSQI